MPADQRVHGKNAACHKVKPQRQAATTLASILTSMVPVDNVQIQMNGPDFNEEAWQHVPAEPLCSLLCILMPLCMLSRSSRYAGS